MQSKINSINFILNECFNMHILFFSLTYRWCRFDIKYNSYINYLFIWFNCERKKINKKLWC